MRNYICEQFSNEVDLPENEIFNQDLTLSDIMARSENITNSIDLMEIFAKLANRLEKEKGIEVTLPAFSLDTRISEVLSSLLDEIEKAKS
jgi:serine protease inhibitor